MSTNLTLVILAGGLGSRYGGIKQMDSVGPNDEAILDYSVYYAIQTGFNKVIFVLNKTIISDFKTKYNNRFGNQIKTEFVIQDLTDIPSDFTIPDGRQKPWGTGHAVRSTRDMINEPFIVINADDFYGRNAYMQTAIYLKHQKPNYAMYAYKLGNTLSEHGTVARGVCKVNDRNKLLSIVENTSISRISENQIRSDQNADLSDNTLVSMNFWAFTPDIFPILEKAFNIFLNENHLSLSAEFYIPTLIQYVINNKIKDIDVLSGNAQWFGMTYKFDREETRQSILKLIDNNIYPIKLWL